MEVLAEIVKNYETNALNTVKPTDREDIINAIHLDSDTIDEALGKCHEDIYSAFAALMFAVLNEDDNKIKETLTEIKLKREIISVLTAYKKGLLQLTGTAIACECLN